MGVMPGQKLSAPAQKVGNKLASSGALGPEGKAAAAASGAGKSGGGKAGRSPKKITPGMSSGQVNDELQARRATAAQASQRRQAAQDFDPALKVDPQSDDPNAPQPAAAPAPASSGAGLSMPAPVSAAASTGGGFLLGLFAWALGLAYLRGGSDEVRKLLAAKFLNKTS